MKQRFLIAALLPLLAMSAAAQMRMHPSAPPSSPSGMMGGGIMNGAMAGAMVTGTVDSASGSMITLTAGIVIDASQATVVVDGVKSTLSSVARGDYVVVLLKTDDVVAEAPLVATIVAVIHPAAVTLTGDVQAVDTTARTLMILGRTISIDDKTTFAGPFGQQTLADVKAGTDVMVAANVSGGKLVATSVMVMGTHMQQGPTTGHPRATLFRGIVKSIATDKWVITSLMGNDVTVLVNAQTRIIGNPVVNDKVDVMLTSDANNNSIALAIMKSVF